MHCRNCVNQRGAGSRSVEPVPTEVPGDVLPPAEFPIYGEHSYCGLLTTNCIGRWLADRLASDELAASESVSAVMKFAEAQDSAALLPSIKPETVHFAIGSPSRECRLW